MAGAQFDAVGPHLISLFFYNFDDGETRLVYGWVLPIDSMSGAWLHKKSNSRKHVMSGRFDAQELRNFLASLLDGKSFTDCCVSANLSIEKLPEFIKDWRLSSDLYRYRDQCIFPPKDEWSSDDPVFVSPSNNTLAEVESLFLIEKSSLIRDPKSFQDICEMLKDGTGLSFVKTQAGRLGNVEWFSLPAGGIFEDHKIDFYFEKYGDLREQVLVQLSGKHHGELLVNIRCKAASALVLDEVLPVVVDGEDVIIKSTPCERPNLVSIRIWKKYNSNWRLYHDVSSSFFSSINFSSHIDYPVEKPVASELSTIKGANKSLALRIEKISTYTNPTRFTKKYSLASSYREAMDNARRLTSLIAPEKSSSLFLPVGYTGKVEFYEWLKNVTNGIDDLNRLIIIDPYLDEEAILFIPYFNAPRIEFTLIANTKFSKDSFKRRVDIINQAELVRRSDSALRISIFDVIKDKQLVHDRYILLQNKAGFFCKGFNLSNSIQSANKNYPLLICEIPLDVLSKVQDWVGNILKDGNELEEIWNSTLNVVSLPPVKQEVSSVPSNLTRANIKKMIPKDWSDVAEAAYQSNLIKKRLGACIEILSDRKVFSLIDSVVESLDQLITTDDSPGNAFINNYCALTDPKEILSQASRIGKLHSLYTNPPSVSLLISQLVDNRREKVLFLFQSLCSFTGSEKVKGRVISNFFSYVHLQIEFGFNLDFWISIADFRISAIAALKIGSMIKSEVSVYEACSKIRVFDLQTQFLILLGWASDLRSRARYRQPTQSDISGRVRELFDELKSIAPLGMSVDQIQSIIIQLGGPGKGWVVETVNDLLIDLIHRKIVSIENVATALYGLTIKHFDPAHHFSLFSSGSLFEATGWAVSFLDAEDINLKIKDISLSKHESALRQPFLYSISFEKYNNSNISLHKKLTVLITVLKYRKQLGCAIDDLKKLCVKYYEFLQGRNLLFATSNVDLNEALKAVIEYLE